MGIFVFETNPKSMNRRTGRNWGSRRQGEYDPESRDSINEFG